MSFKNSVKIDKAFKNLLGYAYSEEEKYYWEEGIFWSLPIASNDIWVDSDLITFNDPTQAELNGVVRKLDHYEMTPNSSAFYNSKDRAWTIRSIPGDESSDILTGFIPHVRYGDNYRFQLYDYDDNLITVPQMIENGIIFDYSNGVLVLNNDSNYSFTTPFKITVWQYIGSTLSSGISQKTNTINKTVFKTISNLPQIHVYSINDFRKYVILPPECSVLVKLVSPEPEIIGDQIRIYADNKLLVYGSDWWFYSHYPQFTMHKNLYGTSPFHFSFTYNNVEYVNADIIILDTSIDSYTNLVIELTTPIVDSMPYFEVGIDATILSRIQAVINSTPRYVDYIQHTKDSIKIFGSYQMTIPNQNDYFNDYKIKFFIQMSSLKDSNDIPGTMRVKFSGGTGTFEKDYVYPSYFKIVSPTGFPWVIEELSYGSGMHLTYCSNSNRKMKIPKIFIHQSPYVNTKLQNYVGFISLGNGPRSSAPFFYRCRNLETGAITNTIGPFGWVIKSITSTESSEKYIYGVPYFPR